MTLLKKIKADFRLAKTLTDKKEGEIVLKIRAMLPSVPCLTGCSFCCENVGTSGRRFFSRWEWARITDKRTFPEKGPCPYLNRGKCDIYEDRPLICRVYGTTPGTLLACKYGQAPKHPLPIQTYKDIERMRYVLMIRAMSSKQRKIAYKSIVKDIKQGQPTSRNTKSFKEMWSSKWE